METLLDALRWAKEQQQQGKMATWRPGWAVIFRLRVGECPGEESADAHPKIGRDDKHLFNKHVLGISRNVP